MVFFFEMKLISFSFNYFFYSKLFLICPLQLFYVKIFNNLFTILTYVYFNHLRPICIFMLWNSHMITYFNFWTFSIRTNVLFSIRINLASIGFILIVMIWIIVFINTIISHIKIIIFLTRLSYVYKSYFSKFW